MTTPLTETVWLNATDVCSFDHVVEVSGLRRAELRVLVDTGVIQPSGQGSRDVVFHTECIVIARKARRLRDDFDLDADGLALAVRLLCQVERLEGEVAGLRARLGLPGRRG